MSCSRAACALVLDALGRQPEGGGARGSSGMRGGTVRWPCIRGIWGLRREGPLVCRTRIVAMCFGSLFPSCSIPRPLPPAQRSLILCASSQLPTRARTRSQQEAPMGPRIWVARYRPEDVMRKNDYRGLVCWVGRKVLKGPPPEHLVFLYK